MKIYQKCLRVNWSRHKYELRSIFREVFEERAMNYKLKIAVFWVVAPCSLVEVYQRFRGPCCLHHQGDHRRENLKSY
jgi:hypothetical protein